jgi:two-component system CheB/CheR fusion protein
MQTPRKKSPVMKKKERNNSPKRQIKKGKEKKKGAPKPFPIVGIGASAGGLEAFTAFLQHLSPDLDMAYIFVQHLSPDHESLLP